MSELFPRVGALQQGYRVEQVDRYFEIAHEIYDAGELEEMDSEGVRTVAFDVVRGGYQPDAVDSALDRLEAAFLQRRRAEFVAANGRQAWMDQVAELATSLYPRLLRPAGERFAPAPKVGYSKQDVDALMDRIAAYFDSEEPLTSAEVRTAVFGTARGAKAYDESSVDRYLARVVEVVFSYPGLGSMAVSAVTSYDYPLVQTYVLWTALIYMVINLLVDVSCARLDPRVRRGARS